MYNQNGTPYYGDANYNGNFYAPGFNNAWGGQQPVFANPLIPQPDVTAPAPTILTNEEMNRLKKMNNIEYTLTSEEHARFMCDHKDENSKFIAKNNNNTNLFYCPRCNRTFSLSSDSNSIETTLNTLGGFVETIKTLNTGTVPVEILRAIVSSYAILSKSMKPVFDVLQEQWSAQSKSANNQSMYGYGQTMPANYNSGKIMSDILNTGAGYQWTAPNMPQQVVPNAYGQPMATVTPNAAYVQPGVNYFDNNGMYQQTVPVYNPATGVAMPAYNTVAPVANGMVQQPTIMMPNQQVANVTNNPTVPAAQPTEAASIESK